VRTPQRLGYLHARMAELTRPETRASGEPLGAWAERRIRLEGRPFAFRGHGYLRAIYDDTCPHVVLVKASQVGGSVYAILRALHACLSGLNVMYFFPTRTDVIDFSKARVAPLIGANPFLSKMVSETDTAGLKRIGEAYLHLRGMQSTVGMKSVPADMLVFDELDEATPEAKAMARERLAHSDYKRIIELSNPSLPDFGIDEAWQESDQRHWMNKCQGCGLWVSLVVEFPVKLGEELKVLRPRGDGTWYRACPKCSAELNIESGEWVPQYPDRNTHGYLISQLFSSRMDPADIVREYRKTRFPERFYNLKIGIAWVDAANRLDVATVLRFCGPNQMLESSNDRCTMGVDTGRELHVVISRKRKDGCKGREIVFLGVLTDYAQLDDLMKRFTVSVCVIDALPEIHITRNFAKRHAGRVWLNYFNEHQKGEPKWEYDKRMVQENRTEALDLSRRIVRDGERLLPRETPIVREFAQHLAADAKQLVEDDETGAQEYRYVRTGTNHFSMAFTYDCLAAAKSAWAEMPLVSFGNDDPPGGGLWTSMEEWLEGRFGHW
jgi:hypothetical protein